MIIKGIFLFIFLLTSCEKEIHIDLPEAKSKIVVEGSIEAGEFAKVILTKNSPYFAKVDSITLINMLITNAIVTVGDGTISEQLVLTINQNYFPPLVYQGSKLKGEVGKTYFLNITVGNIHLSAQTTIPQPIPLDSVWFSSEPGKGDTLGLIWAKFTDPPERGNNYRIFTQRLGKDRKFIPLWGSVTDDSYFNGKTFVFSMFRGLESLSDQDYIEKNRAELGYFKVGDTVIIKNCVIDKAHFDFWSTYETEVFSGGNPFGTPVKIKSNINGDGLGIWGGYSPSFRQVIAKKK